MTIGNKIWQNDQPSVCGLRGLLDDLSNLRPITPACRRHSHTKLWSLVFNSPQHADLGGLIKIQDDGRSIDVGCNLLEYLQHFPSGRKFGISKARDITAGMREACHKSSGKRINNNRENNGNSVGLTLQRRQCQSTLANDNGGFEFQQFAGGVANSSGIISSPSAIDSNIAALNPPQVL